MVITVPFSHIGNLQFVNHAHMSHLPTILRTSLWGVKCFPYSIVEKAEAQRQ